MTQPTPTIDVERLAREAGIDDSAQLTPYMLQRLSAFAALVLEEAAKVCDDKAAAIRLYCNEAHVVECADELRALAAGVR